MYYDQETRQRPHPTPQPMPPPAQDGWLDLYRRIQALEFHAAATAERNSLHGADLRKLRDKLEEVRAEHNATLTKVLMGVVGLVGSAVFSAVWGLISKTP